MISFSIDLRSEKQTAWTGNTYSGNGDTLLDEAWAEEGLNGCNLMIAFTGKNFPYGGWGYVGGAGCLLLTKVILLMPALHVMKLVTIMVAPISTTIRILRSAS